MRDDKMLRVDAERWLRERALMLLLCARALLRASAKSAIVTIRKSARAVKDCRALMMIIFDIASALLLSAPCRWRRCCHTRR